MNIIFTYTVVVARSSSQHQDLLVIGFTHTPRAALSTAVKGAVAAVRCSHAPRRRHSRVGTVPAVRVSVYLGKASSHRGSCAVRKWLHM